MPVSKTIPITKAVITSAGLAHPITEGGKINSFPDRNLEMAQSQCRYQYVEVQNKATGASQPMQLLKRAIRFQGQIVGRKKVQTFLVCFKGLTNTLRFQGHVSILWTGTS